jgi:cytoskeletal protein CcmA (bactofilin family)
VRNRRSRLAAETFAQPYPKPAVPVGQHLSITGEIAGDDDVELHGRFSGTVDVQGMVLVGETAEVRAEIKGSNVVVLGSLRGNVTASGRVVVASTGELIGNVRALGLVVSDGAGFRGHVNLGPVLDEQRPVVRPVNAAGGSGEAFRARERTAKSSHDRGPRRNVG